MDKLPSDLLGDRDLQPAVEAPADLPLGAAVDRAGGRWTVVVDARGVPVGAVPPGAPGSPEQPLWAVLADLPPTVVAGGETPMKTLLASWTIDELEPDSAIVVTAGSAVAGVWAGADMRRTVAMGASRTSWDTALPGDITIPQLSRTCRRCRAVVLFPERPDPMPACPNPAGLPAHDFAW
ncbi:MAG: hypothetical protein HOY78_18735 [Saccharothrix sp.]|nr:hypothetical protein [Saccharothrix sp.]